MARQVTCSVVIPVYNSAASLPALTEELAAVLPEICAAHEVIFVNDGSRDNSWDAIQDLAKAYSSVSGVNMMRNFGQHNALLAGIRLARHEIIVTMDDDLQHPPDQIALLLEKLAEGYDVVYGSPKQEQHGLLRDMASRITKLALKSAMGIETASQASAFRAFRAHLREAFKNYDSPTVSVDVLLTWGTRNFSAVQVRHERRQIGTSNYTFWKLVKHALNMITGYTVLPLHFASLMGFIFMLVGLGLLVFVIGRYAIEGESVPGFPFLASAITIFSGVQLFALGIIGEYLARLYQRSLGQPSSVIHEIVGREKEQR